jgi:hypothetical protein
MGKKIFLSGKLKKVTMPDHFNLGQSIYTMSAILLSMLLQPLPNSAYQKSQSYSSQPNGKARSQVQQRHKQRASLSQTKSIPHQGGKGGIATQKANPS